MAVLVASLTLTSLLCVFSHEVTVKSFDLMPCNQDDRVCVTAAGDCVPPPSPSAPPAPSRTTETFNVSCYFEASQQSVTCEWSEDLLGRVSLIFSRSRPVIDCKSVLNPSEQLMITARVRSSSLDVWSQPRLVDLFEAAKPSPPELGVVGSGADSLLVAWRRSGGGGCCRLRYRAHGSEAWAQAPDLLCSPQNYSVHGLQPFTVYTASVACSQTFGVWSDWSAGVSVTTLDRAPFTAPQPCYRLDNTDAGGRLHVTWQALDPRDAGGRVLGYQVSYRRVREGQLQDRRVVNVTEEASALEVDEGTWSVSVAAFNTAGVGPSASLSLDTRRHKPLPSVRHVWVSSSVPAGTGLWVQWEAPSDPPPARVDVWWRAEANASTSWSTASGSAGSALIRGVDPAESYLVGVVAVYQQQCAPPRSLTASPRLGALVEPTKLKVTGVNKTAVTVMWAWQRKSRPIRVDGYRALWPDQWQHSFLNLTPNTEYRVVLLADNVSIHIISVPTQFDEVPVVATATPLLLLALTVFIVSFLSRTVYKSFFHPRIQDSTAGQWLMDSKQQPPFAVERSILHIQDFQETDVLGVKSAIVIEPRRSEAGHEPGPPRTTTQRLHHGDGGNGRMEQQTDAGQNTCDTDYLPNVAALT